MITGSGRQGFSRYGVSAHPTVGVSKCLDGASEAGLQDLLGPVSSSALDVLIKRG